jgi:hypothetical protein
MTRRAVAAIAGKALCAVLWIVCFAPFALWVAMVSEAVRAWHYLGRWPSSNSPDPKTLPLPFNTAIELCVGLFVIASGGAIALWVTRRFRLLGQILLACAGAVAFWLLAFLLLRVDPGGVAEWYFD